MSDDKTSKASGERGSSIGPLVIGIALLAGALGYAVYDTYRAPEKAERPNAETETSDKGPKYDESQPGADDPRVKEGFSAYKQGDFKKAYDIWLPLAEAGNAEAQYRIGRLYRKGDGVSKDPSNAMKYWIIAAGAGHTYALTNLGYMYDQGVGVEKSFQRAFKIYHRASLLCDLNAQYNLGTLILRQPRETRDNVAGHKWLEIAALRGDRQAEETSKKLARLVSTTTQLEMARQKAQEWLESHPCETTN